MPGLAVYVWRFGNRIRTAMQFPPPRARVIRDTIVVRGSAAAGRASILQAIAIVLGLGAVGLNGLFGSQGPRWNRRTGWHYLAITNTTDLVHLHTRGGLVILSPSRPDEFTARLDRRLAKEDSS